MLFRDQMDETRTVEPLGDAGPKSLRCRVYFDGVPVGQAAIPKSLFGNAEGAYAAQLDRIGFVPTTHHLVDEPSPAAE